MKRCLNIYFAPYKTCNLRCNYCYVPTYNKKERSANDGLVLTALKDLLAKFENEHYAIGSFCLHGAEPALLSPKSLADISALLNAHWEHTGTKHKRIAIQSNGTLFSREYLETLESSLKSKEGIRLGFSIDPPKPVHDAFRNRSFDLVEKNYELALKMGFPVSVLSVVTNQTMNHLDDFKSWMAKQLERNRSTGNPYRVKVKLATGKFRFSLENMSKFSEFIIENNFQKLIQILSPGYCLQAGNECEWYEFDVDGNCYSCNKTFNEDAVFASWRTDSFDTIVAKRSKLFDHVIQHQDCSICEYEYICNSGCPVDRYQSGAMAGKAPECDIIKSVFNDLDQKGIHLTDFYNLN